MLKLSSLSESFYLKTCWWHSHVNINFSILRCCATVKLFKKSFLNIVKSLRLLSLCTIKIHFLKTPATAVSDLSSLNRKVQSHWLKPAARIYSLRWELRILLQIFASLVIINVRIARNEESANFKTRIFNIIFKLVNEIWCSRAPFREDGINVNCTVSHCKIRFLFCQFPWVHLHSVEVLRLGECIETFFP